MADLSDFLEATAFVLMNFKVTKQNTKNIWSLIPHICWNWGFATWQLQP